MLVYQFAFQPAIRKLKKKRVRLRPISKYLKGILGSFENTTTIKGKKNHYKERMVLLLYFIKSRNFDVLRR